ncbi:MAG TPA: HEAT repeat domain-containing protein [Nitrospira sp.]
MMRLLLLSSFLCIGLAVTSLSIADQDTVGNPTGTGLGRAPTIYLDVHASTWRPRGRVSFGIVPSLRMKVTSAGYAVTEDPQAPHDLTLTVEYREERGAPISINLSGTEITCAMLLEHSSQGRLFTIKVHVVPRYAELVSAPYVEVVERLQANPYFYFLGDLIRGRLDEHLHPAGALIQAVDRQFAREQQPRHETPLDTLESPAETFPDLDLYFAASARENAIEELGRLKDPRAIDLLERLMFHPDRGTRLRAVLALREFDAPPVAPAMMRVVQTDSDTDVRNAAAAALARFSAP